MNDNDIKELFALCDANNSGYIEKQELNTIIPNADCTSLQRLLDELDSDGDGRISLQELETGLHKLTAHVHLDGNNNHNNEAANENYMERRWFIYHLYISCINYETFERLKDEG